MKVIAYRSAEDIDIEFLDNFHYVKEHQSYVNFKNGSVKNPYDKTLHGIGYLGVGKYVSRVDGKRPHCYGVWDAIIDRCYCNKEKYPAYCDQTIVCDEWHNYQNFARWYEENEYECNGRLHVDKDILYPGNKIYSPYHCLLVPQRINMLFANKPNKRGLPNGIREEKGGYTARYNGKELGVYGTIEEAYGVYAETKERAIKQIADEYINIIPKKVYDALYAYKVNINNDKNWIV